MGAVVALVCAACPQHPPLPEADAGPPAGIGGVVAVAGADLAVLEGSRVQLAGEGTRSLSGTPRLSWSQVAGEPVLLTNPSSTLPSFVAPLAPAVLGFELRAETTDDVSADRVTVVISSDVGDGPAFLLVPGDMIAEPGGSHTFNVGVAGTPAGAVTLTATVCRGASAVVTGSDVTVTLPDTLPCGVVIDGIDENGRGLAPATRVFWPAGTALPGETRLSAAPFPEPGGAAWLSFADDAAAQASAWAADGATDGLLGLGEGDLIAFNVPRRRARLAFAGEARLGSTSGGVRVAFIEVTDGAGNVAPRASGGNDRVVQPNARFRIDTTGSFDLDGDDLAVRVTQMLGDAATPLEATGVFLAPTTAGTLLFHVVADDGTVESPPDPVRVVVSPEAENLRPTVPLAPRRFVAPGQTFSVDGSVAEDPDSGVLSSITVRQLVDDPVILLDEPVELLATLVAGAAGDTYHFEVTAFDDQGLGGTGMQEVVVEEAGPFVDPARGDDSTGTGTAAAPFRSIEGALVTAINHELAELVLAEGDHDPTDVVLPRGLSLRGGVHFDGSGYVAGGAETMVPVVGTGLVVTDAGVSMVRLRLLDDEAAVQVAGSGSLADCTIEQADGVTGGPLIIEERANVVMEQCVVRSALAAGDGRAAVSVAADAALRVVGGSIVSGDGDIATTIRCDHGTLVLEGGSVTGGALADDARAIDAQRCNVELVGATVVGGAGLVVVGLAATNSVVTVDEGSAVTAANGISDAATAVLLLGANGSALLGGNLSAADDGIDATAASAVECSEGALALARATITAAGENARGVVLHGTSMTATDSTVTLAGASTVAFDLTSADDVLLTRVTADATGGLQGDAAFVALTDCLITGVDAACNVPNGFVAVSGGALSASSVDGAAALVARGATLRDTVVTANGATAEAVSLANAASLMERTVVAAAGADGVGVAHAGSLTVSSSFVTATGLVAVRSAGPLTLRNATVVSNDDGVAVEAGGSLVTVSSAIFGDPSLRTLGAPPWISASATAFDDVGTYLVVGAEQVVTEQRLTELGCADCLVVPASLIDGTGHLTVGANALVDAGDRDQSATDDLDGDQRPLGAAPDVGCDERL